MAKKLKNLKITKVDFVDEGANPDADIGIRKKRDAPDGRNPAGGSLAAVSKGDAKSFSEEFASRQRGKVAEDIWNMCCALSESLTSALFDDDLTAEMREAAMRGSIREFESAVGDAAGKWAEGKPAGVSLEEEGGSPLSKSAIRAMEEVRDRLSERVQKAAQRTGRDAPEKGSASEGVAPEEDLPGEGMAPEGMQPKGEEEEMRIDKSRMTPAERAMLEEFEKRYGAEGGAARADEGGSPEEDGVEKAASAAPLAAQASVSAAPEKAAPGKGSAAGEDIYKGLNPAVRAEIESLRKFKESVEEAELRGIAKRYELIGRKEEELFPVLKNLKTASPAAFEQMVGALDSALDAAEKSSMFAEVGKSGNGSVRRGGVVKEVEAKAAELMKSRSGLSREQAIDRILSEDAELARRYETEED